MIIVYGTRFFGKSDVVEGVGHVACRFVHVMFAPLVPIETVFLLEGGENRGVKLPFSFKAAVSGWLRGGSIFGVIGSAVGAVSGFASHDMVEGIASGGGALFFVGLFFATGALFGRCSQQRRAELLGALGVESDPVANGPVAGFAGGPPMGSPIPYGAAPAAPPPAGGFGAPQGAYGAPQGAYGAPQGAYGAPQGAYGAPQGAYGAPQGAYGAPPPGYGPPQGAYGAPPPQPGAYGAPPPGYGAPPPQPGYGPPQGNPTGAAPQPGYGSPSAPPGAPPGFGGPPRR